jgi:ubiquinone/menaquinone biosynthesis C-methylase UbiE
MSPASTYDVCPAERSGWLTSSFRRLLQNPERILRGLVQEGQAAVDLGCGPGFFTLPLAQMVGPSGRVMAVLQDASPHW